MPLKIDDKMLSLEYGIFARILVDLNLSKFLPERLLVKRKGFSFLVHFTYENLPQICANCGNIGHSGMESRRLKEMHHNRPMNGRAKENRRQGMEKTKESTLEETLPAKDASTQNTNAQMHTGAHNIEENTWVEVRNRSS